MGCSSSNITAATIKRNKTKPVVTLTVPSSRQEEKKRTQNTETTNNTLQISALWSFEFPKAAKIQPKIQSRRLSSRSPGSSNSSQNPFSLNSKSPIGKKGDKNRPLTVPLRGFHTRSQQLRKSNFSKESALASRQSQKNRHSKVSLPHITRFRSKSNRNVLNKNLPILLRTPLSTYSKTSRSGQKSDRNRRTNRSPTAVSNSLTRGCIREVNGPHCVTPTENNNNNGPLKRIQSFRSINSPYLGDIPAFRNGLRRLTGRSSNQVAENANNSNSESPILLFRGEPRNNTSSFISRNGQGKANVLIRRPNGGSKCNITPQISRKNNFSLKQNLHHSNSNSVSLRDLQHQNPFKSTRLQNYANQFKNERQQLKEMHTGGNKITFQGDFSSKNRNSISPLLRKSVGEPTQMVPDPQLQKSQTTLSEQLGFLRISTVSEK